MKHPAKLTAVEAWMLKDAVVDGRMTATPLLAAKRLIRLGYLNEAFPDSPHPLVATRAGKLRLLDPAKLLETLPPRKNMRARPRTATRVQRGRKAVAREQRRGGA